MVRGRLLFPTGCKQLATHWPSRSARQLHRYSRYKACLLQLLCYSSQRLHIQHVLAAAFGGTGLFESVPHSGCCLSSMGHKQCHLSSCTGTARLDKG
jgi:hypothetical protein